MQCFYHFVCQVENNNMRKNIHLKVITFFYCIFCFSIHSFSQKTEINLNAYSGLFSFRGDGAAKNTEIISLPYTSPQFSTINAYGKNLRLSCSFEIQAQRITKSNFIFGLGICYELLTSKINIDTIIIVPGGIVYYPTDSYPATGATKLKNSYFNLNPFVGKRFTKNKLSIDVLVGVDMAFCLRSHESSNASFVTNLANTITIDIQKLTTDVEKPKPTLDFRPRLQFKFAYKKVGILLGYSLGLTNYQNAGNGKAFSNFIRMGVSFRLK